MRGDMETVHFFAHFLHPPSVGHLKKLQKMAHGHHYTITKTENSKKQYLAEPPSVYKKQIIAAKPRRNELPTFQIQYAIPQVCSAFIDRGCEN